MSSIRILADRVANQIAAGEVVERPASVVKELLENSLDAGAKRIEVEFRNGGKSYIRVEDDGHGMSQDQALLSLERHATSKIREAGDLTKVKTFGFRGEALPSIASVSRFTMRTRSSSEKEGCEIFVNGGKMIHVKDCGMPPGTRIEVAHLFNSVPGRRKFLKTVVTESTHLMHLAKLYALAHPQISFSLLEGGRTIFKSPACKDLEDRVREIFGKAFAERLGPVKSENDRMALSGLIGNPGQSRSTRKEMLFFVNHRPVDSKTLSYATIEAYHTFIPKGRFPPAILFLELEPSSLDVNVHPSKKEIRFREEANVRNFVLTSLLKRNQNLGGDAKVLIPSEIKLEKDQSSNKLVPQIDPAALSLHGLKEGNTFHGNNLRNEGEGVPDLMMPESSESDRNKSIESNQLIPEQLVGAREDAFVRWRLIDRPEGDLALFSTPQGLVAMHGRAAVERIRFERLEDCFQHGENESSQKLLMPETLELDPLDSETLNKQDSDLKKIGFEIEEFGRNYFRVTACPHWLDPIKSMVLLRDFLDISRECGRTKQSMEILKEALIKDSALLSGKVETFSDEGMIGLAKDLLACRNPYTCPKGNPTYFEIPSRDFENRFRRKL